MRAGSRKTLRVLPKQLLRDIRLQFPLPHRHWLIIEVGVAKDNALTATPQFEHAHEHAGRSSALPSIGLKRVSGLLKQILRQTAVFTFGLD